MNEINLPELRDALETVGFRKIDDDQYENDFGGELSFYRNYSGRAMYGNSCFGITVNSPAVTALFFCALREFMILDDVLDVANDMNTDNMGRDTIVYFPGHTAVNDED
jgi:hypothetical protein